MKKGKVSKKVTTKKDAIPIFDLKGSHVGSIDLPSKLLKLKLKEINFSQIVRAHLLKIRSGGAATKTRGEIRGGGRKPWRQKGTGRARAGSIRSPQWRGGGVVHGPKPRSFEVKINKKQVRKALLGGFLTKFKEKRILALEGLENLKGKTKEVTEILNTLNLDKNILLILNKEDSLVKRAVNNLENVIVQKRENISVFEVLKSDWLIFSKKALEEIFEKYEKNEK